MASAFVLALLTCWRPLRLRRRRYPRARRLALSRLHANGASRRVLLRDVTPRGIGLLCLGERPQSERPWRLSGLYDSTCWGRVVYAHSRLPGLWRVGIERIERQRDLREPECELVA